MDCLKSSCSRACPSACVILASFWNFACSALLLSAWIFTASICLASIAPTNSSVKWISLIPTSSSMIPFAWKVGLNFSSILIWTSWTFPVYNCSASNSLGIFLAHIRESVLTIFSTTSYSLPIFCATHVTFSGSMLNLTV